MPREVSDRFLNEIEASYSGDLELIFATITSAQLVDPIRIVSEGNMGVSFRNGLPVNYRYEGQLYRACPFETELLTDTDRPPQAAIRMPDPDGNIGLGALTLVDSPSLKLVVLARADFSEALDSDNARNPTGVPSIEYMALYLQLRNISGDQMQVSADIFSKDPTSEPWPRHRTTPDVLPGINRG